MIRRFLARLFARKARPTPLCVHILNASPRSALR